MIEQIFFSLYIIKWLDLPENVAQNLKPVLKLAVIPPNIAKLVPNSLKLCLAKRELECVLVSKIKHKKEDK